MKTLLFQEHGTLFRPVDAKRLAIGLPNLLFRGFRNQYNVRDGNLGLGFSSFPRFEAVGTGSTIHGVGAGHYSRVSSRLAVEVHLENHVPSVLNH